MLGNKYQFRQSLYFAPLPDKFHPSVFGRMLMKHKDILKLYNDILKNLKGDWILVGGALLHVLGVSLNETLDIDLVPLGEVSNRDQMQIMEIAIKNGFPPETINFAAEYYVKKQRNWENELVLLAESGAGRIFRPTKKLFKALKQARGTETDLLDIKNFDNKIND